MTKKKAGELIPNFPPKNAAWEGLSNLVRQEYYGTNPQSIGNNTYFSCGNYVERKKKGRRALMKFFRSVKSVPAIDMAVRKVAPLPCGHE
jgi:hypothetical protein